MQKTTPKLLLLIFALSLFMHMGCIEDVSDARSTLTNDCSDCIDDTAGGNSNALGDVAEFTATAGNESIILTWIFPPDINIAGVMIRRSTESFPSSISMGTEVYNDSGISFPDDDLDNSTTYYYTAFAHDDVSNYAGGVQASAIPRITSPVGLTVAVVSVGNALTISWDNVTGASGYNLYWATDSGVAKATGTQISGVTSLYNHPGLANGIAYYYVVTSLDATSESNDSTEASGIPEDSTPPFGLTLNDVNSPTNVTPQIINGEKEADTSIWINGDELVPLDANTTWSWSISLNEGDNSITVSSKDASGNESGAVAATITMDTVAPAVPTLNTVSSPTNITPQTIGGSKDVDTSIWINGSEVVPLDANGSWSFGIPLAEGENSISVTSKDAAGNESGSVTGTITFGTVPPATVNGFTASHGDGQVTLDWTNPVDNDFSGVVVCRDAASSTDPTCAGEIPAFTQAGTAGATQGFTDGNLNNGTTYVYTIFTNDIFGNHSGGVSASARPSILSSPTQITLGERHTCVLDSNGVVCWGEEASGIVSVPPLSSPTQVSAGQLFTCALDSTGVVCWGSNSYGQASVPALSSPTQVSAGGYHGCALDSTGVVCWGENSYGQASVPALSSPTQVSAGGGGGGMWAGHTCALDSTGVVCWGHNSYGQTNVPSLSSPIQVSAGYLQTCALDSTGVVCWGENSYGQASVPALSSPTQVWGGGKPYLRPGFPRCGLLGVVSW